jgi:uncharacterized protein
MFNTWILSAGRTGDLQQMQLVAQSLGMPTETVEVRFRSANPALIALWPGRYLSSGRSPFVERPHPDLVICAEASACALAAQAKRRGGRFKLVCIGRPRGRYRDFDAIITSPQYALPPLPNVTELPVAPHQPVQAGEVAFDHLKRPLCAVLVGGTSRPDMLNAAAAEALALHVNALAGSNAESVAVVTSPRTSAVVVDALRRVLDPTVALIDWKQKPNPYGAVIAAADRFIVTSDSVSMTIEALMTGKPVTHFKLPQRPSAVDKVVSALWQVLPGNVLFYWGLIEVRPDRNRLFGAMSKTYRLNNQGEGQDVPNTAADGAKVIRRLFETPKTRESA